MVSRQPGSQRRSAPLWRLLALLLLLPVPGGLAQVNDPAPAMASPAVSPAAAPGEAASPPAAPERPDPAPGASEPPAPEVPASQPTPPAGEAGTERPSSPRPMAPSRAPGAAQSAGQARRRRPAPTPSVMTGEPQTPPRRQNPAFPAGEGPQPDEDFGRWERNAPVCDIELVETQGRAPERLACRSVRLDQQLAGLLSVRFLPAAQGEAATAQQLLFAGVLLAGSQPMRCRDSRCEPSWPIRVQVSALATSNARTLGLPLARVVQGSCSLETRWVLCQARDREGRRWKAQGRW